MHSTTGEFQQTSAGTQHTQYVATRSSAKEALSHSSTTDGGSHTTPSILVMIGVSDAASSSAAAAAAAAAGWLAHKSDMMCCLLISGCLHGLAPMGWIVGLAWLLLAPAMRSCLSAQQTSTTDSISTQGQATWALSAAVAVAGAGAAAACWD
jgi:hypothetical protein